MHRRFCHVGWPWWSWQVGSPGQFRRADARCSVTLVLLFRYSARDRSGRLLSLDHRGWEIAGPIITTQSEFDTAVGRFYPLGAGIRQQVAFVPGELPTYGGLGTFGARGPGLEIVDLKMLPADGSYPFEPGVIYNLESSQFIREGGGPSGAHGDILRPEVAHAVWEAVRL